MNLSQSSKPSLFAPFSAASKATSWSTYPCMFCEVILKSAKKNTQIDSKVGNLATPAPQIWCSEAVPKQLNLKKLSDAGGSKDADAWRSQKPTVETICVCIKNQTLRRLG